MSSELVAIKTACGKTITEAACAAGDAAAARAITGSKAEEVPRIWASVFQDTGEEQLLAAVPLKERVYWVVAFIDHREHRAREALESLKQQADSLAALDAPFARQAAAILAERASKISADESLDAIIRVAAGSALADAARILADAAR
jgi:hypothetical protein